MDSEHNNGGPAFPYAFEHDDPPQSGFAPGMKLRDWFAGQAMAVVQKAHTDATGMPADWEACALGAYALADAMLAERRKNSS